MISMARPRVVPAVAIAIADHLHYALRFRKDADVRAAATHLENHHAAVVQKLVAVGPLPPWQHEDSQLTPVHAPLW